MSRLFAAMDATWPAAEVLRLGPWTLRRTAGAGHRVSAATRDGPAEGLEAAPEAAAAVMRGWGQRPLFLIRPGDEGLDAALAGTGHAVHYPSTILAAPAAELALAEPDERAIACEGPLACMAEIWAERGVGPERRAVMDRAAGPKAWLLGRLGDRPAACAFVAIHGDLAMLHALGVAPAARRRGLGALLSRAAALWALRRGTGTLALTVADENAAAAALYAGLGMAEAARYHYRLAPGEGPP